MNIILHLGEPFWRCAGTRQVTVWLPEGATAAEALAALVQLHPALRAELDDGEVPPALFAGDTQVWPETPLQDGAHVYILWAMSGG